MYKYLQMYITIINNNIAQVCQPQKVEREPYTGPVIEIPSSK